jgi:hypothetical protein
MVWHRNRIHLPNSTDMFVIPIRHKALCAAHINAERFYKHVTLKNVLL